jgi:flagellar basal-body rod protein FlgB
MQIGKAIFDKMAYRSVMKSLDAGMLRSRVIANNIANATTPGYRRVEVKFEEELREAISKTKLRGVRTDESHIDLGKKDVSKVFPRAYKPVDPTLPSGVNNVDIDTEMAKLAQNQIMFNYGVRFAQGAVRKLNAAIQGRSIQQQ